MSEIPGRHAEQFNLRLPDGMRERLKEAAGANKRSMNAEIISRLQDSFDPIAGASVSDVGKAAARASSVALRATLWHVYSMLLEISEIPGSDIGGTLRRMRDGIRKDLATELDGSDALLDTITEIGRTVGDKDGVARDITEAILCSMKSGAKA